MATSLLAPSVLHPSIRISFSERKLSSGSQADLHPTQHSAAPVKVVEGSPPTPRPGRAEFSRYPVALMGRCTAVRTRLTSITWPESRRRMRTTSSGRSCLLSFGVLVSGGRGRGRFGAASVTGLWCVHRLVRVRHQVLLRRIEIEPEQRPWKIEIRLQPQRGVAFEQMVAVAHQKMAVPERPQVAQAVVHRP